VLLDVRGWHLTLQQHLGVGPERLALHGAQRPRLFEIFVDLVAQDDTRVTRIVERRRVARG
jgi:hypothetical protein